VLDWLPGNPAVATTLSAADIMPSYVVYIPQRLGGNLVLDSAVDLVFSAAGHLTSSPALARPADLIQKYVSAISFLRDAIFDPIQSMSAEVLAAVSLLSIWEVGPSCQLD
jgi:hypothetical protein